MIITYIRRRRPVSFNVRNTLLDQCISYELSYRLPTYLASLQANTTNRTDINNGLNIANMRRIGKHAFVFLALLLTACGAFGALRGDAPVNPVTLPKLN